MLRLLTTTYLGVLISLNVNSWETKDSPYQPSDSSVFSHRSISTTYFYVSSLLCVYGFYGRKRQVDIFCNYFSLFVSKALISFTFPLSWIIVYSVYSLSKRNFSPLFVHVHTALESCQFIIKSIHTDTRTSCIIHSIQKQYDSLLFVSLIDAYFILYIGSHTL